MMRTSTSEEGVFTSIALESSKRCGGEQVIMRSRNAFKPLADQETGQIHGEIATTCNMIYIFPKHACHAT